MAGPRGNRRTKTAGPRPHHWDQTGLVVPSAHPWSGRRPHSASGTARIHTVLVYGDTGMRLDAIGAVLDGGSPAGRC